jgi:carboxymethylenebutenolidase
LNVVCYEDGSRPPLPPIAGGTARGEDIVLTTADSNRFSAYLAVPDEAKPAQVLILPDVRGLHPFYKELADRFAEQGITALAIDYFGRTAGLGARGDAFDHTPHTQQLRFDEFMADVAAALAYLRSREGGAAATFTVGFCMGGSLSLLACTQSLRLEGVISFYSGFTRDFGGHGTALEHAEEAKYPILAMFGGADPGIPAEQVRELERRLAAAGVEHDVVTYPGAPHSFFDRRATEFAEASADAWTRMLGFIRNHSQEA